MGRSIIADEAVEAYIEKLVKTNKWFVGVIIGQVCYISVNELFVPFGMDANAVRKVLRKNAGVLEDL